MRMYGEFDFIADIRKMFARVPNNNFEGIGDDCAVLPIGGNEALVFTSDMLNEGIHFLTDKSTAYQIGYKSLMVNVSVEPKSFWSTLLPTISTWVKTGMVVSPGWTMVL